MSVDPRDFRNAMAQFATGIVIVTCRGAEGDVGMTMNSFSAVSLDPPLVLFSIDRRARGLPAFEAAAGYAVNVLAAEQEDLSSRFARAGDDKWAGVEFSRDRFGAPVLRGNIATLECRAWRRYDGGDHVIVVAEVLALEHKIFRDPLLFFRGRYAGIGALTTGAPPAEPGWPLSMHY